MKPFSKRILSFLLILAMLASFLPTIAIAAEEATPTVDYITQAENALVENDVISDINSYFTASATRSGTKTLQDYVDAADDIKALVMASDTYVEGSIVDRGDGFFWQTTAGIACGYFPKDRYEADQRTAATKYVNTSSLATWDYNAADQNDVCLIAPMYAEDSTFSDQYVKEAVRIANALGGTAYGLIDTAANVDAIGQALEKCGVVIFDSHGNTDWGYFDGGSDGTGEADCVSQANTSYLCLSTGSQMTTADCAYVSGDYGSYPHAYKDSYGNYVADGTAFANHMDNKSQGALLWMAICLGMATDGMCAPLYDKGISVVYGYSQSVTFYGDYLYEETFWDNMLEGTTVAAAISDMKNQHGNWDPYYEGYSQSYAKSQYAAFPIVVSAEDAYPGHGKTDALQTVNSTYTLFKKEPVTITLSTPSGTSTLNGTTNTAMTLPTVDAPAGYSFAGWTTTSIDSPITAKPTIYNGTYTPNASVTLYALFTYADETTTVTEDYVKVTTTPSDWSGEYVIVYEPDNYVFKSSLSSLDSVNNYQAVTITNDTIAASDADAYKVTIAATDNGYSILAANGNYIGQTSDGNGLVSSTSALDNSISLDSDGNVNIVSAAGAYLRYNSTAGQYRFRYYKSSTYANQQPITLYMKGAQANSLYYTTNPTSCAHSNTTSVEAIAPTCTEIGYTAGVYCNDCSTYISGHAELEALGHSYSAVVTPPTASEMGYSTYTCTACGDSYIDDYTAALGESYTVSFVVPEGVAAIGDMTCGKDGIELPNAGVPTGDHTYTFVGWAAASVDNETSAPEYYTGNFVATEDTTLYALYSYAVGGTGGSTEFVLKDIANISATDIVVITSAYDGTVYALSSFNGTSASPAAITVTVENNKLTEEPAQDLLWNVGGSADAYIFYPDGHTDTWLYCTSSNTGVRVGTNENNTFSIASNYLYNNQVGRYLGVYRSKPDWRCYTSNTTNIGDQTLAFYVKSNSGTVYYTTVLGEVCEHSNTTESTQAPTCTETGLLSVICSDCGATISTSVIDATGHNYNAVVTAPTCTEAGYTTYTCSVCEDSYTADETAATGHHYADGICTECNAAEPTTPDPEEPTGYEGRYYIATIRASGNYYYMTNDLGTSSTKRYQAQDSGLTELPSAIAEPESDKIFVLVSNDDGTYSIYSEGIADDAKYLGHVSGNSGILVDAASALSVTVDYADGIYTIHFAASDAERYLALNNTSGNNYFAWYKSGQKQDLCLIPIGADADIHVHNVAQYEGQAATCTADGIIAYYYCADSACPDYGKAYSDEALSIEIPQEDLVDPATGHSCSYTNNGNNHTVSCANCDYSETEDHTYEDGACICGATESNDPQYIPDPTLEFNMNISAGADMKVVYTIYQKNLGTYTDFYLVVNKAVAGGEPVTVTYGFEEGMESFATTTTPAGAAYMHRATFAGVYAREMGDVFEATLYAIGADGNIYYSNTNASSMKSYLTGKIEAESSIAELKTMCVDMLNYGAAAQLHFAYDTENLVNADLTDEQKAYATSELPEAVNSSATEGEGVTLRSSVSVKEKVYLNLTATYTPTDASALKAVICDAEGNVIAELPVTVKNNVLCQASYGEVGAKQMRQLLTATLYEGDKAVSTTITWSVESYVATVRANGNAAETQINMVNAMLTYGDAVATYMTASGQG